MPFSIGGTWLSSVQGGAKELGDMVFIWFVIAFAWFYNGFLEGANELRKALKAKPSDEGWCTQATCT